MKKNQDYRGFTFDNIHSSQLNLIMTPDNLTYEENLIAPARVSEVELQEKDGIAYCDLGSSPRDLIIHAVLNETTPQQYEEIKKYYSSKKVCSLIFDEWPYKIYYAKLSGVATAKVMPSKAHRDLVYFGKITLNFTLYENYAVGKYINQESLLQERFTSIENDRKDSGLLFDDQDGGNLILEDGSSLTKNFTNITFSDIPVLSENLMWETVQRIESDPSLWMDSLDIEEFRDNKIKNSGDTVMNWSFVLTGHQLSQGVCLYWDGQKELEISPGFLQCGDCCVEYNSFDSLIYGCDKYGHRTGTIYPNIVFTTFYQIPMGEHSYKTSPSMDLKIKYKYLYL